MNILDRLNNRIEQRLKGSVELEAMETEDGLAKYKAYQERQLQLQGHLTYLHQTEIFIILIKKTM